MRFGPRARLEVRVISPKRADARSAEPGWFGEAMPLGMRRASTRPVYVWDGGLELDIEMLYVPPGAFVMGSSHGCADERPEHMHPMPSGFYVSRYATTWRAYRRFCSDTGRSEPPVSPRVSQSEQPVVNVTWADAATFCQWARLALPTEAQWEKAARGTDGRRYPWGDAPPTSDRCVLGRYLRDGSNAPVGSCPGGASPYGALDMVGNTWEWCADWYGYDAYRRYVQGDLAAPETGRYRVSRGGSWGSDPDEARASLRDRQLPERRGAFLGFRPICLGASGAG